MPVRMAMYRNCEHNQLVNVLTHGLHMYNLLKLVLVNVTAFGQSALYLRINEFCVYSVKIAKAECALFFLCHLNCLAICKKN